MSGVPRLGRRCGDSALESLLDCSGPDRTVPWQRLGEGEAENFWRKWLLRSHRNVRNRTGSSRAITPRREHRIKAGSSGRQAARGFR